jgi:hypothetical protein
MKKELNNMIINYTAKDLNYIEEMSKIIESSSKEITNFFGIEKIEPKIEIYLYDSLDKFRKKYIELGYNLENDGTVPLWVSGFAYNEVEAHTLCLEEYRKTRSHENDDVSDLEQLILHEFVHGCYNYFIGNKNNYNHIAWLSEGLATTLSHQYDKKDFVFTASLDEMENGCQNYSNYHLMFSYVLNKYGKDYILNLINDNDVAVQITPKLYEETRKYYNKN